MRFTRKLLLLGTGIAVGKVVYDRMQQSRTSPSYAGGGDASRVVDTPTGTDPNAKYSQPGYEDKSLGQAGNQDQELADRLLAETGGDTAAAEARFRAESAGAPVLREQESDGSGS